MKKALSTIIVCAFVSLLALACLGTLHFLAADFAAESKHTAWQWFALVHVASNQFVSWREGLVAYLAAAGLTGVHWINLAVFGIGFGLFVLPAGRLDAARLLITVSTAGISVFVLASLLQEDRVALAAMAWLPWILIALREFLACTSSVALAATAILCAAASLLFCQSANQLAPFVAGAALAALWPELRAGSAARRRFCIAVLLLPALIAAGLAPDAPLPDYPPEQAHLVPDDGVPGITRSILGSDPALPCINRNDVKHRLAPYSVLLLAFAVLAAFGRVNTQKPGIALPVLFSLALCLCLDVLGPEALSEISPLLTLSRLLPGAAPFSLAMLVLPLLSMLLLIEAARSEAHFRFLVYTFSLLVSAHLLPVVQHRDLSPLEALSEEQDSTTRSRLSTIAASPSYYLLRENGIWVARDQHELSALKETPLNSAALQLFASTNSESKQLAHILDPRPGNRWSAGGGKQRGSEWLKIVWNEAQALRGIELDTGKYSSDFPRGLRVSSAEDCAADQLVGGFNQIAQIPSFQGPIRYSTRGFPYFGPQSEVRVYFDALYQTRCLLIEQIGEDNDFDWSVSAIRILAP